MMGLCASVQSLLRTVGPTAGGFMYENYGISSIGLIQFVVNIAVFVYLLQHRLKKTTKQKEWTRLASEKHLLLSNFTNRGDGVPSTELNQCLILETIISAVVYI